MDETVSIASPVVLGPALVHLVYTLYLEEENGLSLRRKLFKSADLTYRAGGQEPQNGSTMVRITNGLGGRSPTDTNLFHRNLH